MRLRRFALMLATLLLAAFLFPGMSQAGSPTSSVSAVTTSFSTISANSSVTTTASCASDVLVGGGGSVTPTAGGIPSNSLKLEATFPSDSLGNPDGATSPPSNWSAGGGAQGQDVLTSTDLTSYAMCLAGGPTDIQVTATTVSGPNTAASTAAATATCPTGYEVVGGGALTGPASSGSLKPIGSFPADTSGNPVDTGTNDPTSWTAVGLTGAAGTNNTTTAYVTCAPSTDIMTEVVSATVSGPTTAGTAQEATASCTDPGFTTLLGGGVNVTNGGGTPQQALHMTGDFPSDSSGNPVASGTTDSWSGIVQAGGLDTPGTQTSVMALCADPQPNITVSRPAATSGPSGTFSEVRANAACPTGQLAAGGGVSLTYSTNGIHLNGTEPSADGVNELTGTAGTVATDAANWMGISGSGGQADPGPTDTPFALCFKPYTSLNSNSNITGTTVVMNSVQGPTAQNGVSLTVANCPSGTRLLSGGARTTPASAGSLKPIASFPTYQTSTSHLAAGNGNVNPDAWAAVGLGGGPTNTTNSPTTYAFAVCTRATPSSKVTTTVHMAEVAGPIAAGSQASVTVTCNTADGNAVGGGAAIDGGNITTAAFRAPGSQGDHLTGTFPSDASGNPLANNTMVPEVWKAVGHKGGQSSSPGDTVTDAWALCVSSTR